MSTSSQVSLISRWFVKPGRLEPLLPALEQLAEDVRQAEAGTLAYLVHTAFDGDSRLQSLPPADSHSILFFETYSDADSFLAHLDGPVFNGFVSAHGADFLEVGGKPYTTVEFLSRRAGFVRGPELAGASAKAANQNLHPAVMFEIIANDQAVALTFYSQVFGWQYETGTGGFAYIHFPAGSPSLLGGIGQADPSVPGFAAGRNFYLLVDQIEPVLDQALSCGASPLMPATSLDGYRFAMFLDPEGNPIGLIEPFAD